MSEYFLVALGHSHHPHHRFVPHVVLAPLLAALLLLPLSAAATVLVVASVVVFVVVFVVAVGFRIVVQSF